MKKGIWMLAALLTSIVGWAQKTLITDDHAQPRTINGSFDRIRVTGAVEVILSQYSEAALAVSSDDPGDIDMLMTELDGDLLKIYPKANGRWNNRSERGFKIYVALPSLRSVHVSGASQVKVAGMFETSRLSINLTGASKFRGGVTADLLELEVSGASAIRLMGKINKLQLDASGASDVKAFDAEVQECVAQVSGASDLQVRVFKKLSAEASGASNIQYKGNPQQVETDVSGASRVRSLE